MLSTSAYGLICECNRLNISHLGIVGRLLSGFMHVRGAMGTRKRTERSRREIH